VVLGHVGRVGDRVTDAIVHGGQAGGARVTQPGGLHGGRPKGENPKPVPLGVPRQIEEDVNAVGSDHFGCLGVREFLDLSPAVGQLAAAAVTLSGLAVAE
jgi:hypothetical protein